MHIYIIHIYIYYACCMRASVHTSACLAESHRISSYNLINATSKPRMRCWTAPDASLQCVTWRWSHGSPVSCLYATILPCLLKSQERRKRTVDPSPYLWKIDGLGIWGPFVLEVVPDKHAWVLEGSHIDQVINASGTSSTRGNGVPQKCATVPWTPRWHFPWPRCAWVWSLPLLCGSCVECFNKNCINRCPRVPSHPNLPMPQMSVCYYMFFFFDGNQWVESPVFTSTARLAGPASQDLQGLWGLNSCYGCTVHTVHVVMSTPD